ncbi:MAG: RNA-binding protein [Planctomycetaceae bacterium]|nr:RNA-binding protein [Planctomycetaceae bacterium]
MTRIYVGNLSYTTTEGELRSTFERYGRVATVHMMTERGSGRSRGFAFVGMGSFEDADEAITRLNGASLGGRNLVVNPAEERDRPVAARTPNILDLL